MDLKQLSEIGMKTVIVIQTNGKVISGKITSHTNVEGDLNKITEIKVMPPNSIPVAIAVSEIETVEVMEDENYYLNLTEV